MPLPGATPEWWFAFTQILVVLMLAAGVTLAGLRPVRRLFARLTFLAFVLTVLAGGSITVLAYIRIATDGYGPVGMEWPAIVVAISLVGIASVRVLDWVDDTAKSAKASESGTQPTQPDTRPELAQAKTPFLRRSPAARPRVRIRRRRQRE